MEAKVDFEVDNLTTPTTTATGTSSFSQLLFGDDDDHHQHQHALGFATAVDHYNPLFSIDKPPKMLSFGDFHHLQQQQLLLPETNATPQKSVITSSDSSSASSCNHTTTAINSMFKTNKKRNWPGLQPTVKVPNSNKKNKTENPSSTSTSSGHAKKKEKLGERIAALQQLVSPFGKTDTASVLHEAMGYIRFLHDQVQVLCSPYLQRLPSSSSSFQHQCGEEGDNKNNNNNNVNEQVKEDNRDLRSMGLCLIPLQSTLHVSSTNGADFWSPAGAANNVTPYAHPQLK